MKRLYKFLPFFFLFLFSFSQSFSQEDSVPNSCSNGKDDGNDGFIDCYDSDCSGNDACTDFFFGNNVTCMSEPEIPTFAMKSQWGSDNQTANSHASPLVGDLDQDGIPEVVVNNRALNTVTILNGEDGTTYKQLDLGWPPENVMALANVLGNDCAYIFVYRDQGKNMVMLDCKLKVVWKDSVSSGSTIGNPAFADFNQDGNPELYHRNEIRNAATGAILVDGYAYTTKAGETWGANLPAATVAIDMFDSAEMVNGVACTDCSGLELAAGRYVYAVNISAGTLTEIADINNDIGISPANENKYFPKKLSGVSIADYNLDGKIDVLLSGALGGNSSGGATTVFFWDVANATVETYADPGNNHSNGTGRLNIADLDGDGKLNVNYVSNDILYSLDENMRVLWSKNIKEGSSGFTGMTLFDFDDDGIVETIYRSEENLLIIRGTDGSTRTSLKCTSRTQEEYPVVADVDGDGASEICVTCYTSDRTPFDPSANSANSHVRVFQAGAGESWQPSRSVWNQSSYFNVNINDDLTIPIQQQNHSVIFSSGECRDKNDSLIIDFRPLNNFMVQSAIVDENGCSNYVTPDLELATSITASKSKCPDTDFNVTFSIGNMGDIAISGSIPVTFYDGDPFPSSSRATKLNTVIVKFTNLGIGQTKSFTETVIGSGGDFMLYIVINDAGGTPPITFSPATLTECDDTNNVGSIAVTSDPFNLTVEKVNDNRKCSDTLPDNGEARAYYTGTFTRLETLYLETFDDLPSETTSDDGTSTTPPSAWTRNSPSSRSRSRKYAEVRANNGNNRFEVNDSDTEIIWTSNTIDITGYSKVTVTADMFAEGNMETSGVLRDYMNVQYILDGGTATDLNNGEGIANFGYQAASIDSLSGSNLVIQVIMNNNGRREYYFLDNVAVSGYSENTDDFTEAAGFLFEWFNSGDDPDIDTPLHTGSTYPAMATGDYIVRGYYATADCYSDVQNITIERDRNPNFNVLAYQISELTSCVSPDGEVTAFAYREAAPGTLGDSLTTGYSFEWRLASENVTTIGTGPTISLLTAETYIVYVTENLTGCTNNIIVDVTTDLVDPGDINVVAIPTDITFCGGTGDARAYVDESGVENTGDYTFEWYIGTSAKATPDYTGTPITGLPLGDYTVRAIQNGTGCPSLAINFMIDNTYSNPSFTSPATDNTSCSITGTGSITVVPDGIGSDDPADYTYAWYLGDNESAGNALPGVALASAAFGTGVGTGDWEMTGLVDGIYTIVVTKDGCSTKITQDVSDNVVEPTFNFTPPLVAAMNNMSCDTNNPTGMVDMTDLVDPLGANYEYTLYNGNGTTNQEAQNLTGIFGSLEAGSYTMVARDTDSDCDTDPLFFSITSQPDIPNIVTAITDDTYCNGSAQPGTGQIAVTSSSTVNTTYKYELFDGASFSTSLDIQTNVNGATGFTFDELDGGTYRIQVTDETLLCDNNVDVIVGDISSRPTFNAGSTLGINNTSCSAANGQIRVAIDGGDDSRYFFFWYKYTNARNNLYTSGLGKNVLMELSGGLYNVVAINLITNCQTTTFNVNILDIPSTPDIVIHSVVDQTGCSSDFGSAKAYANEPDIFGDSLTEVDGFSFQWYKKNGSARTPVPDLPNGGNTSTVSGLISGIYTVEVTDPQGCTNTKDMTIRLFQIDPVLSLNGAITPNTGCNTGFTGAITVSVEFDGQDPVGDLSGYGFRWYDGSGASKTLNTSSTSLTSETISGVPSGRYTVVVTAPNGCQSNDLVQIIPDNLDYPSIVPVVSNNTLCQPRSSNGSIDVTITSANPPSTNGYTIELHEGEDITGHLNGPASLQTQVVVIPTAGVATVTLGSSTHESGHYSIVVINKETGCRSVEEIHINDEPILPTTESATPDDNTSCDSGNGTGSISVVMTGGNTDKTFAWYTGDRVGNNQLIAGEESATISGLTNGEYTYVVTDDITNCESIKVTITVGESLAVTTANESALTNNSVCDPSNNGLFPDANGAVTVTPTTANPPGEPANYTFALRTSGGTDIDNAEGTNGYTDVTYALTGSTSTVGGLPAGAYIMAITNSDNVCTLNHPFTIADDFTNIPVITLGDIATTDNSSCDDTAYTGTADASTAVASGSGNYSYKWTTSADPGTVIDRDEILDDSDNRNTGVLEGTYLLTITDREWGCTSVTLDVAIGSDKPMIEIDPFTLVDNFSCDNNPSTGGATVNVKGGNAGHTFTWHNGSSGLGGSIDNDALLAGVIDGVYSVIVTNTASTCFEIFPVTIDENEPIISLMSTPTDQTNCSPDGKIDVTASIFNLPINGFTASFTFEWYYGRDVSGTPLTTGDVLDNGSVVVITSEASTGASSITGLYFGDYTVIVTETSSSCVRRKKVINVADSISASEPSVTFYDDPANGGNKPADCANEDGRIRAAITLNPDNHNFTFEWYEGTGDYVFNPNADAKITHGMPTSQGASNPQINNAVPGARESTLDQITSGLYTLVTIDGDNGGCRSQHIFNLGYNDQQITSTIAIKHVETCSDDGTATISIAEDPSDIDADYTADSADDITQYFIWLFAGDGVPVEIYADSTYTYLVDGATYPKKVDGDTVNLGEAIVFRNLPAGSYTAIAREKAAFSNNLCWTAPAFGEIRVRAYQPIFTSVDITDNSICTVPPASNFNGSITIEVEKNSDDTVQPGSFRIVWYEDGNPAPIQTNDLVTTDSILNKQPGDFYAKIFRQIPTIDVTYNIPSGSFTADSGTEVTFSGGATGVIITNIGTLMNIYLTSGSTATATGMITKGSSGETAIVTAASPVAGRHWMNKCEITTDIFTIQDLPEQHEIASAEVTGNVDCNPLDGTIEIDNDDITDDAADYTFTWYFDAAGTDVLDVTDVATVTFPGSANGTSGANAVSGLPAGTYYVQATHDTKGCETPLFAVEIDEQRVIPIVQVSATADDLTCDDVAFTPTGAATANVIMGGLPKAVGDYTFTWYMDSTLRNVIDSVNVASATFNGTGNGTAGANTISGLPEGTYYVVAEDNTNSIGCKNSPAAAVTIDQFNTIITVESTPGTDFNIIHADHCNPLNGGFEILAITETQPGGGTTTETDMSRYSFNWVESDGTTPLADALVVGLSNGDANANEISGLDAGTYFVRISNTYMTGCVQTTDQMVEFTINNDQVIPLLVFVSNIDDISCDDATPTGKATVNVMIGGALQLVNNYEFYWYNDDPATGGSPIPDANIMTVSNGDVGANQAIDLQDGNYFVVAVDVTNSVGCQNVADEVIIEQFETDISVLDNSGTDYLISPNENCSSSNGTYEVRIITETQPGGGTITGTDMSLYSFEWFESDGVTAISVGNFPGISFPNGANRTTGASAITGLPAGTYSVRITNTTTGCKQDTFDHTKFIIEDISEDPVIALPLTNPGNPISTFCNDGNPNDGNGTLNIEIYYKGVLAIPSDYERIWYRGDTVTLGSKLFTSANQGTARNINFTELTGLSQGFYTLYVERTTGTPGFSCSTEMTFEIAHQEDIPTLDENTIAANAVNNAVCNPGYDGNFTATGSIVINDADVSTGDLGDFKITVEKDSVGSGDIRPSTSPSATSLTISGLESGDYYISARNTTSKCLAAAVRINIRDVSFSPYVQLIALVDNLNCAAGTDAIGSITVTADGFDETNTDYAFQWFLGSAPVPMGLIGGATNATLQNLTANTYTVRVRNMVTGCETIRVYDDVEDLENNVEDLEDNPIISSYDARDQSVCNANGMFALYEVIQTGITLDTLDMDAEGYVLEVFTNPGNVSQGTASSTPYEIIGLVVGSYYAVITNNGSNCTSDQVDFEVEDAITYPLIAITVDTNDDPCSIVNGQISATADDNDDTHADYQFAWYFYDNGTMTRGVLIDNTSTIIMQEGGFYEVEVTNSATGCTISQVAELTSNDPIDPVIDGVQVVDAFDCNSPNGFITITSVNQNTPQDYSFDLYDVDSNLITNIPAGTDPIVFGPLAANDYLIFATHDVRGCVTPTALQVTIEDMSTPPDLVFSAFDYNTRCDVNTPNGSITITATTSSGEPSGYTYDWVGLNGTPTPTVAQGLGTTTIFDVIDGEYQVTVTNGDTGCPTVSNSYILPKIAPEPLKIVVSTEGSTNCVNGNGKMAAIVVAITIPDPLNPANSIVIQPKFPLDEYDYLWYDGHGLGIDPLNPPIANYPNQSLVEDLPTGEYTIVVRNGPNADPLLTDICSSAVVEFEISDDPNDTYTPIVEIERDQIYCYTEFVQGLGIVKVINEDLGQYAIQWTSLTDPSDTHFPQIGFYADSLVAGNYRVTMTNLITGCVYPTDFSIIDVSEVIPMPNVTLIANNTNCTAPNGEAVVTVDDATQSYLFEWFDADDDGLTTVLLTGSHPVTLVDGSYIVRVTNLITGCISDVTPISIDQIIPEPVFEIVATNSLCLRTEDGAINQFNGDAYIGFSSFNFVDSAAWFDSNGVRLTHITTGEPITDGAVGGLSPGDYKVSFRADNGCDYNASFIINTAVQIFNFVTANGDTRNDFFMIDCLDFYPNNNVKIFTRAGQQVYEVDGYDNFANRFDGTSERNKPLPSGTYFYIIDKGDGSELVQGYLELVK